MKHATLKHLMTDYNFLQFGILILEGLFQERELK